MTGGAILAAVSLVAATFIFGFLAFCRGKLGGGDVKLLTVCMAWAGPDNAVEFLIVTGLAGGVLALALLSLPSLRSTSGLQRHWPKSATTNAAATSAPCLMGLPSLPVPSSSLLGSW